MNHDPGPPVSVRFVEEMTGFVSFGERDHERGAMAGRRNHVRLMIHLTIEIADLDRFEADPNREAKAGGWIEFEALGGILPIEAGTFNLLVDEEGVEGKRMLYRLSFRDGVGHPATLTGFKRVGSASSLRVWRDTSTLYTRIVRGHVDAVDEAEAEIVASGILRLHPVGFLRQLTTFRATAPSVTRRITALGRFDALFLGQLWSIYRPAVRPVVGRVRSRSRLGGKG